MTLKEVNNLRTAGFENAEKPQLNEALVEVNKNKNLLAGIEKDIKDVLLSKMSVGEQLSIFDGSNEFKTLAEEKISFDCDLNSRDLIALLEKEGIDNIFLEKTVKTKLLNEAYLKGKLPVSISSHIHKEIQTALKLSKK